MNERTENCIEWYDLCMRIPCDRKQKLLTHEIEY